MRALLVVLLAIGSLPVEGRVAASYIVLEEADGFESSRRYAGQTVAARASELGFKRGGQITEIFVDIGSRVGAGDPLARLDVASLTAQLQSADAEVSVAEAGLAAADAQLRLARNTERRFHRLREQGHAPQQVYDEARLNLDVRAADRMVARARLARVQASRRLAQIALDEATIYAPFGGTVQARHVDEGTQVVPGQPALRIVEDARIEVHVGLPAKVAGSLSADQRLDVSWQGQTLGAELKGVLPEVDPIARTQTAVLTTRANGLPLGSVVELELSNFVSSPGFWVPLSALVESERGLWGAYVINGENTAERRLVEILHSEAERVFVRGTLSAGERLVSNGVHRIVPGQEVTPSVELADAR